MKPKIEVPAACSIIYEFSKFSQEFNRILDDVDAFEPLLRKWSEYREEKIPLFFNISVLVKEGIINEA